MRGTITGILLALTSALASAAPTSFTFNATVTNSYRYADAGLPVGPLVPAALLPSVGQGISATFTYSGTAGSEIYLGGNPYLYADGVQGCSYVDNGTCVPFPQSYALPVTAQLDGPVLGYPNLGTQFAEYSTVLYNPANGYYQWSYVQSLSEVDTEFIKNVSVETSISGFLATGLSNWQDLPDIVTAIETSIQPWNLLVRQTVNQCNRTAGECYSGTATSAGSVESIGPQAVPEPMGAALVGVGLMGLMLTRRRAKQQ